MTTFQNMRLHEPIVNAIVAQGYDEPTPIQAEAIPAAMTGRDILGCAQTGTGKTCAFAVPILHRLAQDEGATQGRRRPPRALILCPTRELAMQIGESFAAYGRMLDLRHTVVYGGVKQARQVRALREGVDVLIATPGRLLDLVNQRHIRLDQIESFVLDEADRMLDMGFIEDIRKVVDLIPKKHQTLFFSATVSRDIHRLADSLLTDAIRIETAPESTTVELIEQRLFMAKHAEKPELLKSVLDQDSVDRVLVFTKTRIGADRLVRFLRKESIRAEAIHADKTQHQRTKAMKAFKNGSCMVLIATDIASRGIDVDNITHVVNFDMPIDPETYVHRIGRTARAGARGIAISFCDRNETKLLKSIERRSRIRLNLVQDVESLCTREFSGVQEYTESPTDRHRYQDDQGRGKKKDRSPRAKGRKKFSKHPAQKRSHQDSRGDQWKDRSNDRQSERDGTSSAPSKRRFESPYGKVSRDKKPYGKASYDKKSSDKKPYGEKSYDKKSYDKKSYGEKSYDKKSYDKKSYGEKSYDKKSYDKKSYGEKSYDKKSYDKKSYGEKSYDKKSYDKKSYGEKSYDKKSYDKKSYGEKSYDKKSYDKKSYGEKSYDKKSYDKKSYGEKSYDKKSYGEKPYGSKPSGKKSFGKKPFGKKPFGKKTFDKKPPWANDRTEFETRNHSDGPKNPGKNGKDSNRNREDRFEHNGPKSSRRKPKHSGQSEYRGDHPWKANGAKHTHRTSGTERSGKSRPNGAWKPNPKKKYQSRGWSKDGTQDSFARGEFQSERRDGDRSTQSPRPKKRAEHRGTWKKGASESPQKNRKWAPNSSGGRKFKPTGSAPGKSSGFSARRGKGTRPGGKHAGASTKGQQPGTGAGGRKPQRGWSARPGSSSHRKRTAKP